MFCKCFNIPGIGNIKPIDVFNCTGILLPNLRYIILSTIFML